MIHNKYYDVIRPLGIIPRPKLLPLDQPPVLVIVQSIRSFRHLVIQLRDRMVPVIVVPGVVVTLWLWEVLRRRHATPIAIRIIRIIHAEEVVT
jgi:hypothetical protein